MFRWGGKLNRGSMDPVHILMDPVHGRTGSTDGVHGPGVHVLYFPLVQWTSTKPNYSNAPLWNTLSILSPFYSMKDDRKKAGIVPSTWDKSKVSPRAIQEKLKVNNDHRSKFSNLSSWNEEAWKNQGFINRVRTRDLRDTGAKREYPCATLN